MIRKLKYSQLTESERNEYRKIWVGVLNNYCSPDTMGNRPCDWGVYCEKCHTDLVIQEHFRRELENKMNIQIIK